MRSYIVSFVLALLIGISFPGQASAQSSDLCSSTSSTNSVECYAHRNQRDIGLKPAIPDMGCVEFVQSAPGKVTLTLWKDTERTQLVREPIIHEHDGTTGIFRQNGKSFDAALNGWIDLCNDINHSQRDRPFIMKARSSGQCIKMCLLGQAECKRLGYYDQF